MERSRKSFQRLIHTDALSISLLLNVDWFKSFDQSEYKLSALIMSVINLPRNERLKKRWTMVLGRANRKYKYLYSKAKHKGKYKYLYSKGKYKFFPPAYG